MKLEPDGSPLEIGSAGTYAGRRFELVGRVQISRGRTWNHWYLRYDDGSTGWLAEAAGRCLIGELREAPGLQYGDSLILGQTFHYEAGEGAITFLGAGHVLASEGEVPEEAESRYGYFVEVLTCTGEGALLNFVPSPTTALVGRWCPLSELAVAGKPIRGGEIRCLGCRATLPLHVPGLCRTMVCAACGAQMDVEPDGTSSEVSLEGTALQPLIPLGSRGERDGAVWTCVASVHRFRRIDGMVHAWDEYLLHAALGGLQWLSHHQGHWTWWEPLHVLPTQNGHPCAHPKAEPVVWENIDFRPFQRRHSEVGALAGELPWLLRPGNQGRVDTYVAPPRSLACESRHDELLWWSGTHVSPADVRRTWALSHDLAQVGVGADQPNPHPPAAPRWKLYLAAVLVTAGAIPLVQGGRPTDVSRSYVSTRSSPSWPLALNARANDLEIEVRSDQLEERSAFIVVRLTGSRQHVGGFNLHSYTPRYPDGSRVAGAPPDAVRSETHRLGRVPPGNYSVQVECDRSGPPFAYEVSIRSTPVIDYGRLGWLALLGALPLGISALRRRRFEAQRWSGSDYA